MAVDIRARELDGAILAWCGESGTYRLMVLVLVSIPSDAESGSQTNLHLQLPDHRRTVLALDLTVHAPLGPPIPPEDTLVAPGTIHGDKSTRLLQMSFDQRPGKGTQTPQRRIGTPHFEIVDQIRDHDRCGRNIPRTKRAAVNGAGIAVLECAGYAVGAKCVAAFGRLGIHERRSADGTAEVVVHCCEVGERSNVEGRRRDRGQGHCLILPKRRGAGGLTSVALCLGALDVRSFMGT